MCLLDWIQSFFIWRIFPMRYILLSLVAIKVADFGGYDTKLGNWGQSVPQFGHHATTV